MGRTALELPVEEWGAYHPFHVTQGTAGEDCGSGGGDTGRKAEERRRQAWEVALRAARILREEFGASRVVAFGSLVEKSGFTRWSDIDLGAWGVACDRFYSAVAAVTGLSADFKVDLIDPESCRPTVRQALEREGVVL